MKRFFNKVLSTIKQRFARADIIHIVAGKYYSCNDIIFSVDDKIGYDTMTNEIKEYKAMFFVEVMKKYHRGQRFINMVGDDGVVNNHILFSNTTDSGYDVEEAKKRFEISKEKFQKLFRNSVCNCPLGKTPAKIKHSRTDEFVNKYIKKRYGDGTLYSIKDKKLYHPYPENIIDLIYCYDYNIYFCMNCGTLISKALIDECDAKIKGHMKNVSQDKLIEEACII